MDPIRINNTFAKYYENLYKCQSPENQNAQNQFLDQLQFPTLPERTKHILDEKLSVAELKEALLHMNSGNSDGLPIEIYKRFSDKLLPHLLEMFNESYEMGILSPTLRMAAISVLLKPGKNPTKLGLYRPISLMPCDTKICAGPWLGGLNHMFQS